MATKIYELALTDQIEKLCDDKLPLIRHTIVEAIGMPAAKIDQEAMIQSMSEICRILDLHIVSQHAHQFEPQGISVVFVLEESHLAVHTWPERGYFHADIVTCAQDEYSAEILGRAIEDLFGPSATRILRLRY